MALVALNCERCPLSQSRRNVVPPELPVSGAHPKVMFVGRDPGEVEDKTGRPLHPDAPAGGLLRRMIAEVGIPSEWCAYDNVVHCHTPANRGPRKDEVAACHMWVRWVNLNTKPRMVVLLGQEALEAWFNPSEYRPKKPMYPIEEWHGREVAPGVWSVYHPSAALRNNRTRRALLGDLRKVARALGVEPKEPPYVLSDTWPPLGTPVAVDVETDREFNPLGLGMAWRGDDGMLRAKWSSLGGGDWYSIACIVAMTERVYFHNAKFDELVLWNFGMAIEPDDVEDTMLMAYVLRREQEVGSLGLKELAAADLHYTWATMEELGPPEEMAPGELERYCLNDVVATLYLSELYELMLEEGNYGSVEED